MWLELEHILEPAIQVCTMIIIMIIMIVIIVIIKLRSQLLVM